MSERILSSALVVAMLLTVPAAGAGTSAASGQSASSSRPPAAIPVPELRVIAEGCFGHDAFVGELTAKLLRRKRLGLPGTLVLWCTSSRVASRSEASWRLIEVDAELRVRNGEVTWGRSR